MPYQSTALIDDQLRALADGTRRAILQETELEMKALPLLREAIAYCEEIKDYCSRDLFNDILCSEEDHVDWIETQLSLIDKVGLQNYLSEKMS